MASRSEESKNYRKAEDLKAGFLRGVTGTYQDPEGYFAADADVDAFDAGFPPKEKKTLPGQLV